LPPRRRPTPPTRSIGSRAFAYDGLVVDLKLPDADGMTVLDEALARYPLIRAVVITGFGGVEEAVTAIRRGAVDFLIKPFQLSQLSRVLRNSLEQLHLKERTPRSRRSCTNASGSTTSSGVTTACRRSSRRSSSWRR
jgi:DNA-binding NtrC family response regulator